MKILPLDPQSPWPKFKHDAAQTGRSETLPVYDGTRPWRHSTAMGVFSAAVFDGDENAYIGSGDHRLYCFAPDGSVRWSFSTGEIVDTSPLLDDAGRLFFGSGDGHVYALDRRDGRELWRFRAETPAECAAAGKMSFVDWFEGHLSITRDGLLVVPNDNFRTYALNRDDGRPVWRFLTGDQTWSCPAYDADDDTLFMGTNWFIPKNLFAFDAARGRRIWGRGGFGSTVASPLLIDGPQGSLVVSAGFDGMVRAYHRRNGRRAWSFGADGHLYSSPVEGLDGSVIQAGADGVVYALDPGDGSLLWSFDTPEPIRSTPAVDGAGNIYFGNGEGRLYCLSAQGAFRWAYRCIDGERRDMNASPALGRRGIVIGGDDGTIHRIPYEYPLSDAARDDPRCVRKFDDPRPADGVGLMAVTRYGKLCRDGDSAHRVSSNEPLTFRLMNRRGGRSRASLLHSRSLRVDAYGSTCAPQAGVAADRTFLSVMPDGDWTGPEGGRVTLRIAGSCRVHPRRFGLKRFGGRRGDDFESFVALDVAPRTPDAPDRIATYRYSGRPAGAVPGAPASVLEIGRMAPALPTILPSYNQIGFDSIRYHLGFVEGDSSGGWLWGVGAAAGEGDAESRVDPNSPIRFVLRFESRGDTITLEAEEGFTLEFNGWDIPYDRFRLAGVLQASDPSAATDLALNASVRCDDIRFYGPFLKLLGVSDFRTGMMEVAGAAGRCRLLGDAAFDAGPSLGRTVFRRDAGGAAVECPDCRIAADSHLWSLLLFDDDSGRPVAVNYTKVTRVESREDGTLAAVRVAVPRRRLGTSLRGLLMADTAVAAVGSIAP